MKCILARWMISHRLDQDLNLTGWTRVHTEGCPSCLRFFQAGQSLGVRLRQAPGREWAPGIAMASPPRKKHSPPARKWAPVGLAAGFLLLLGATLVVNLRRPPAVGEMKLAASVHEIKTLGKTLLWRTLERDRPAALYSLLSDTLTGEMERLQRDALKVQGFLFAVIPPGFGPSSPD